MEIDVYLFWYFSTFPCTAGGETEVQTILTSMLCADYNENHYFLSLAVRHQQYYWQYMTQSVHIQRTVT